METPLDAGEAADTAQMQLQRQLEEIVNGGSSDEEDGEEEEKNTSAGGGGGGGGGGGVVASPTGDHAAAAEPTAAELKKREANRKKRAKQKEKKAADRAAAAILGGTVGPGGGGGIPLGNAAAMQQANQTLHEKKLRKENGEATADDFMGPCNMATIMVADPCRGTTAELLAQFEQEEAKLNALVDAKICSYNDVSVYGGLLNKSKERIQAEHTTEERKHKIAVSSARPARGAEYDRRFKQEERARTAVYRLRAAADVLNGHISRLQAMPIHAEIFSKLNDPEQTVPLKGGRFMEIRDIDKETMSFEEMLESMKNEDAEMRQ